MQTLAKPGLLIGEIFKKSVDFGSFWPSRCF